MKFAKNNHPTLLFLPTCLFGTWEYVYDFCVLQIDTEIVNKSFIMCNGRWIVLMSDREQGKQGEHLVLLGKIWLSK